MRNNCAGCGHWFAKTFATYNVARAWCTLQPEWRETNRSHFCGQFVPREWAGNVPAAINATFEDRDNSEVHARKQQERAIRAEKELKAVRAQLRGSRRKGA